MALDTTKTTVADPASPALPKSRWLASPDDFAAFVFAWHSCRLPAAEFTHAAHVAVAAHTLFHSPENALDHLRTGIRRFNESVGGVNSDTAGYHETLTRLWTVLVSRALAEDSHAPATAFDAACIAVHALGHRRDLFRDYYSYDVVASREARRVWVAPDRTGPFGAID